MKLFEKMISKSAIVSQLAQAVLTTANEVTALARAVLALAHQVNAHQQVIEVLCARQGIALKVAKANSLDMALPALDGNKDKPLKPN